MFIVTEIRDNSLGRVWGFATLEEAVDRAMLSIKELNLNVDYYQMTWVNGLSAGLQKSGSFTREDMEQHLSHYDGDSSVCIGQLENPHE